MAQSDAAPKSGRIVALASACIIVTGLYFARDVLVPLAVALLLVAECAFKLAGRDRRRPVASGRGLRQQADLAKHPGGRSMTVEGHGDLARRVATPTDPADDLKTSLAELMRDLRRAGAASDPMRSSTLAANRTVDELELA